MSTAVSSPTPAAQAEIVRRGTCLCKSIQFEVKGDPVHYTVCYCKNCQKASGSGFMMNVWFQDENYIMKTGEDVLKVFYDTNTNSGRPLARYFCSNCGSNVYLRQSPELPRSDVYIVQGPMIEGSEVWLPRRELNLQSKFGFIGHLETRPKEKKSSL
ncbi:hypothetical protein GYMLUDRAFT_42123 [Collybiopsis luxurians FD-317 M1]|uniref:CENP-V/GFA domain-containing protein n=1 Tax=Collybiopsis luxurians FD-317 M1 TaxID=944289 RepID=A0A0D0CS76_9AGAR|nr:hypothetical protein GYMLUDRAFT_42123 [Collybiopsis luxurians FD-317 M1]